MKKHIKEQEIFKSDKWEKQTHLVSVSLMILGILSFILKTINPYFILAALALVLIASTLMTKLVIEKTRKVQTVKLAPVHLENTLS